jgi:IS30 family transposase
MIAATHKQSDRVRASAELGLGQIVDTVSIRERPAEAEDRAVPGHWEGHLLCGANHPYMVTLVERASRFAMLLKVPSSDTATVVGALTRHIGKLPAFASVHHKVGRQIDPAASLPGEPSTYDQKRC